LIAFNGGLELQFTPLVSAQAMLSYHVDRANASNGSVRFERTPLELLGHFRLTDCGACTTSPRTRRFTCAATTRR
jgi:hypothetical protein